MVKIAVTGHRPHKLGGYNATDNFKAIRRHMRDFLEQAPDGELCLISGGALGIDQFWMEVGLHMDLPVIAMLPFEGYDAKWPDFSRQKHKKLLDRCEEVVYACESGYEPWKLQKRNELMVDNCDVLTAYWDGTSGGTMNCLDYAGDRSKIINIFQLQDIINVKEKSRQ
jgi:uncharacterized phage-like protein YoqJ